MKSFDECEDAPRCRISLLRDERTGVPRLLFNFPDLVAHLELEEDWPV